MEYEAIEKARERLREAAAGRPAASDVEAALERARAQLEEMAAAAAHLESSLPERIGEAVRDGLRAEASPVARQLAEVRGLAAQTIRRLERLEGDLTAERYSRVDDLGLLVDLIVSGWRRVDERLGHIEQALGTAPAATLHRLDERVAASSA